MARTIIIMMNTNDNNESMHFPASSESLETTTNNFEEKSLLKIYEFQNVSLVRVVVIIIIIFPLITIHGKHHKWPKRLNTFSHKHTANIHS